MKYRILFNGNYTIQQKKKGWFRRWKHIVNYYNLEQARNYLKEITNIKNPVIEETDYI